MSRCPSPGRAGIARVAGWTALLGAVAALVALVGCATPPERLAAREACARWTDRRWADPDSLAALIAARDAHVRLAAVRAAGQIGRQEAVPELLRALDDRSGTVRVEAAAALGFLGATPAVPALTRLVEQERERGLRLAAIEALGRIPGGGPALAGPALRAATAEAAAAWDGLRERSAELPADTLLALVREGLARDERSLLWRVLRCAEKAAPDSMITAVAARHAQAKDTQLRVHALRALGAQGTPQALAAILESGDRRLALTGGDRTRARVAHLRALTRCAHAFAGGAGANDVDPELLRTAAQLAAGARDGDPHVARTAGEAMASLAEGHELPAEAAQRQSLLPAWRQRLLPAAQARIHDAEPAVRAAAVQAWGALRGAAAQDELAGVLATEADRDPQVACAAARGLGQGGGAAALRLLARAATADRPAQVREAALEAAAQLWRRLGPRLPAAEAGVLRAEVAALLAVAARDADFAVAATAASALGDVPAPRSAAVLADLLASVSDDREGACDVRLAALAALESLAQAGALSDTARSRLAPAIARGFDDRDLRVRLAARAAALAGAVPAGLAVPSEAGLRGSLPPLVRDPRQPALADRYAAPRLRCTTPRGVFVIQLDGRHAPNTARALASLAERGYYRGLVFHRVVPDFVVQGGDPRGDGWGGPGWSLRAERSRTPFERGTVGIADSGLDTGASQFFVCHSPQPHLDRRYTVAGRVVSGMTVVDAVQPGDRFTLEMDF